MKKVIPTEESTETSGDELSPDIRKVMKELREQKMAHLLKKAQPTRTNRDESKSERESKSMEKRRK